MEDIIKKLTEEMAINHSVFTIFGIPISETMITMTIVTIVIILLAVFVVKAKKFTLIPSGKQNVIEIIVDFVNNFTKDQVGNRWRVFAPYFGSILFFIFFANIISIFNIFPTKTFFYDFLHIEAFKNVPVFQLKPPTKDINVPITLAIMSISLLIFSTIFYRGIKGFLKTFIEPSPIMLPFKILDYAIRPLTLTLRLFGNIFAAYVIMELLIIAFPIVLPGFMSLYFDLFDGVLQAYIFVFLTSVYIHENLETAH